MSACVGACLHLLRANLTLAPPWLMQTIRESSSGRQTAGDQAGSSGSGCVTVQQDSAAVGPAAVLGQAPIHSIS